MRYTGYDPNNIARVWGEHTKADTAKTLCQRAAIDYVRRRPDTGPLEAWSFTHDAPSVNEANEHRINYGRLYPGKTYKADCTCGWSYEGEREKVYAAVREHEGIM